MASARPSDEGLVGHSPAFSRMLELATRVAPTDTPVLLLGESGTGKEGLAQAIHQMSSRAGGRFVPLDCSGVTESLFESELFGYEKGAFTGAAQRRPASWRPATRDPVPGRDRRHPAAAAGEAAAGLIETHTSGGSAAPSPDAAIFA